MPIVITVTSTGFDTLQTKLNGNIDRARDLTVPMKQGSMIMMASVAQNFSAGGRPTGWIGLSPKYAARKLAQGYSPTPLTKNGYLKASIVPEVSTNSFKLGTSVPYARIHQKGGMAGRKRSASIPARPYLVFQDDDLQQISQLVVDYIKEGI